MSKTHGLRIDSRRRRRVAARPNPRGPNRVVYVALAANLGVAAAKLIVAWLTGSAALLSEGVHSLVDSTNEALLIYGLRRGAKPPDLAHPLGHGREIYFWSFVVALLFFLLGACVSVYEGVEHLLHRRAMTDFAYSYVVIGVAVLLEAVSLRVALKEFAEEKGERGYIAAIRRSKDPATFTVLLEDSAAILGLAIAFAGILGAQFSGIWQLDGIASILIGLLLAGVAVFLAYETKSLLIGEQATPDLEAAVLRIASAESAIRQANGVFTTHVGPDQVVAQLSAEFAPEAAAGAIEDAVERMETRIRQEHPEISALFLKPESSARWLARQSRIEAASAPRERERASRRRAARSRPAR